MQGNSKAMAKCERNRCAACESGKVHCRSNRVNTINKNTMKGLELKKDHRLTG